MRIISMLLSALAFFGLSGCRQEKGGVTDHTNPLAPKTIVSKDISEFYATFCLAGEWSPGRDTIFYTFEVKPDAAGVLTASESAAGVSAPADDALLTAVQQVIDAHGLAALNGEYRTTAGLPPEYWPCTLTARYASGEKLTFTHDNDPRAEWAKELYLAFADWFAAQGIDALQPPETVVGTVTNVQLWFKDAASGRSYDYGIWSNVEDEGRRVFFRYVDGEKQEVAIADEEAFFAGVGEILKRHDLRSYDVHSALYGYEVTEEDRKNPFSGALQLVFWFEDENQFGIHTSAESTIDDLRPLLSELIDYFDAFFEGD